MERVQTKIGAIMLIFLLLTVATAILVQRQGQGADATAINVAGRQRMLSQKMAKEALGIVHGDRPIQAQEQLRQTRDLFERGLSGLIEGDRDLGLGQEQDPAILQRLRQVQTMWEPMRQRVDRLVASDRAASLTDEAAYIYDHSLEILTAMDEIVSLYEARSQGKASLQLKAQLAIAAANVILVVFGWFFIGRTVAKPLRDLVESADAVASGDLSVTITATGKDEVAQLAQAFHRMAESLRSILQTLSDSAEELAASTEELAAAANETGSMAQQIAHSTEEANRLARDLESGAEAMERGAQRAIELASLGDRAMDEAVVKAETAQAVVKDAVAKIDSLNEKAKGIGQAVDVISTIAEQTNLLALNAAIEAARAGEQGRGFAVVAGEIRALAEESQSAAKEIAQLIFEVTSQMTEVVEAVNNSGQTVQDEAELVSAARSQFVEINAAVSQMTTLISQVADIAQTLRLSSHEVATSSHEQSGTIEEVAATADTISAMAQSLTRLTTQFQL